MPASKNRIDTFSTEQITQTTTSAKLFMTDKITKQMQEYREKVRAEPCNGRVDFPESKMTPRDKLNTTPQYNVYFFNKRKGTSIKSFKSRSPALNFARLKEADKTLVGTLTEYFAGKI